MNNVYDIGSKSRSERDRSEEASSWITMLDRGLSANETNTLKDWILTDSKNEAELLTLAEIWDKMDALSRLSEVFPHSRQESVSIAPHHNLWFAVAGSVIIVAFITLIAVVDITKMEPRWLAPALAAEASVYKTAIGGLSKVELSDGSKITMNTNSVVQINFNMRQRLIKLERGEIHIDVAHDPSRPLSVFVGDRIVQAIGTTFSVKIEESQRLEVIVTDGRVKVSTHAHTHAQLLTELVGSFEELSGDITETSLLVGRGERIVLDKSSEVREALEPEEIEVQLSWRDGNLVFRGESLAVATAEISRYAPVEFFFLDEDLQQIRVAGFFKAGDLTGFLDTLNANFQIDHQRLDDRKILLSLNDVAPK